MSTILDSHPDISMGYELLPSGIPAPGKAIAALRLAIEETGEDPNELAALMKAQGLQSFATFVRRAARARVEPHEMIELLGSLERDGIRSFTSLEERALLSMSVVEKKREKEGTATSGFKVNGPSVATIHALFPNSAFVFMLRDPRDVVASHRARGFDRTIEQICKAWSNYLEHFARFQRDEPDVAAVIVRYEDLVTRGGTVIKLVVEQMGVPFHEALLRFFDSKASVHQGGHANAPELSRDFFSSSICRWQNELAWPEVDTVQRSCPSAKRHGYPFVKHEDPLRMNIVNRKSRALAFSTKKKFYRDQYPQLLAPFRHGYVNLTWGEVAAGELHRGENVFMIRHDIDHDIDTALKIGRWEQKEGLRATYCILHSAWYYGKTKKNGSVEHYIDLIEACRELQSLGHEINFHNNVVAEALRSGFDPLSFFIQELWFLRSNGVRVVGSSTHGDALCRDLNFRNYELFSESVYESRGGRRDVVYEDRAVTLGDLPMGRCGFTYEAYDIPRDVYVTDSGGNLRVRFDTAGRAGVRRKSMEAQPPYPKIAGVLTHPIWWDFSKDAPKDTALPDVFSSAPFVSTGSAST